MRHLLLAIAFIASLLVAQELRSTLNGRVTDPAGAAIPKDSTPASSTTAVPTAPERQGDFSSLAGSTYQIYDPNSSVLSSVLNRP